jgi:hypothetical protein
VNGRKARQLRSQGGQKRLRRYRKDVRAAEETLRAEAAEAEAAWQEQYAAVVDALADEPQFAIVNPFNGETLVVAAQSMIWPLGVNGRGESLESETDTALDAFNDAVARLPEATSEANPDAEAAPRVILPGTAEALGIETP